jgi:hypothetical protein
MIFLSPFFVTEASTSLSTANVEVTWKFWTAYGCGAFFLFVIIWLILGLFCQEAEEKVDEEDVGRLSKQYEENEKETEMQNIGENEDQENEGKNEDEGNDEDEDGSSGEDVEVVVKRRQEKVVDDDGNEVMKEVVSHVIIWPDGTEEERPGLPGDDLQDCE